MWTEIHTFGWPFSDKDQNHCSPSLSLESAKIIIRVMCPWIFARYNPTGTEFIFRSCHVRKSVGAVGKHTEKGVLSQMEDDKLVFRVSWSFEWQIDTLIKKPKWCGRKKVNDLIKNWFCRVEIRVKNIDLVKNISTILIRAYMFITSLSSNCTGKSSTNLYAFRCPTKWKWKRIQ